mmetsp:Transcript_22828/g.26478  ORF Transcript_22828/g.26478 Transcript_22828/m.26478 type:complete len:436 (+) Transcript_22828:29-1336(+)
MQSKVSYTTLLLCALMVISANGLDLHFSKFEADVQLHENADEHIMLHGHAKPVFPAKGSSDFYHMVDIGGQSLPMLFSTTADMDYVVGKSCMNCVYTNKPFDMDQAKHFVQTSESKKLENGKVEGTLSFCDLKIGGESTGQTEFVLATKVKYPLKHSGVIALSPKHSSFLQKMQDHGVIENKVFNLKYSDSHLAINFDVPETELANFDFYELSQQDSWSIALDSLSLDSVELAESPLHALFDTSTDMIILPETVKKPLTAKIQGSGWNCTTDKNGQMACSSSTANIANSPFNLTFGADGNTYTIPSSSLIDNCKTTPFSSTTGDVTTTGSNTTCAASFTFGDKPNTVILGQTALKHLNIIFDAEEGRIGLAELTENETYVKKSASKGMLYSFVMGVLFLMVLVLASWVIQKKVMKRSRRIQFEEEIQIGEVNADV